jgi:hypothetical protein
MAHNHPSKVDLDLAKAVAENGPAEDDEQLRCGHGSRALPIGGHVIGAAPCNSKPLGVQDADDAACGF